MILANVAWLLACAGHRVLAVDWDLEAPGLHRYFYPFLVDPELAESDGVIDIVVNFAVEAMTQPGAGIEVPRDWYVPYANILRYVASLRWEFPGTGALDFIPAGRQGAAYSVRVNSFDWQNFYERLGGGQFLEAIRQSMRSEYDYILIDSRTGVSDTSSICTIQMPDILAVCYTLNNQGITGAAAVATAVRAQRAREQLLIFPIPMRLENSEQKKLELRQAFARAKFNPFLDHILPEQRERYWGDIEVPYIPYYAYEEVLAAFVDTPERTLSLLASTQRITHYLTGRNVEKTPPIPEEQRKRILALYEGTSLLQPKRYDFYAHVLLPPHYILRPEIVAEVRASLLTTTSPAEPTDSRRTYAVALHGMGGIGKTVIARVLCDDPAVQTAFPDGILWASLGKNATDSDVIKQIGEWVTALGETVSASALSLNTLKVRLNHLLADRTCLLIVDDVWQYTLVDHFRVGGPYCRLVITTRDAEIARELGARVQPIPLMTEDEAVALLVAWSDGAVVESAMQKQIVRRLGRLPLAIKLAGAQLRRQTPEDWLRRFDVRRLRSSRPENIHDNLEQTFKLSLEGVEAQDQRLYTALMVFREDEAIPEVAIVRLWKGLEGLEREQTSALIDNLASRALLQVRAGNPRTIVLHDLLRDLMRIELAEDIADVHGALLRDYTRTQREQGWHTAPDDGYLYTHLAYHLLAAGRKDELCMLLTASPAWMETKFIAHSGDMAYAADVDLALTAFERAATATELLQLAQLVAVRQVIQQRASMYTNTDLVTLTWLGRDVEALNYVRLRLDQREKWAGLMIVHAVQLKHHRADGQLLVEALGIARSIEPVKERVYALVAVAVALVQAGRMEEASRTLTEALEAARAIADTDGRAEALKVVAVALAHAGELCKAFLVLRPLELYNYLGAITQWLPSLEKLETGLSVAVVREVVRIIGWVWPHWNKDWDKVYDYAVPMPALPTTKNDVEATRAALTKPLRIQVTEPELIAITGGKFQMGSPVDEPGRFADEILHSVDIPYDFAIGLFPVTFDQYDEFVRAEDARRPDDKTGERGRRPVVNPTTSFNLLRTPETYCPRPLRG